MRLGLVVALLATGCHAKFKKHADQVGAAQLQVLALGGADAQLGRAGVLLDPTPESDEEAVAGAVAAVAAGVFNTVQAVKEAELRDRIATAVDPSLTNEAMMLGVTETLGGGPPFSIAEDARSLLQLEVLSWGLSVPTVGASGSFTYTVRARVYLPDGERIYSNSLTCVVGAGAPSAVSQALGLVNNAKQVKQMSDAELQDAFDAMARYCGGVFVTKLRKHAG